MKLYSNPPCRTHHSPTTGRTPCDQQYLRATEVLQGLVIQGKVLRRSKSPKATGRPQAQATLNNSNNHLHKTLRGSTLLLPHKVRSSHRMYV